jgi:opacity protein-like surface antigen
MNTGGTDYHSASAALMPMDNDDLGTGNAFGLSVGKYLTDNYRVELEVTKRTGYKFDGAYEVNFNSGGVRAKIQTEALFVNGFYDFQPFSISNMPITPYLGGGVGISRNKMRTQAEYKANGLLNGASLNSNTINRLAYKLSAGALFNLTDKLSLDVNYQYVNLGAFKGSTEAYIDGVRFPGIDPSKPINGGEIKTQELMVGLQYTFK